MFTQLTALLEQLLHVHRQLIDLAIRKREVIVKGDLAELQATLKDETALVNQLHRLERERTSLIEANIPRTENERQVTMSELLERVDGEQRTHIQQLMKQLLDAIEQLKQENAQNETLVHESLQYVHHTLNLLTANPADDYVYQPQQSTDATKQNTANMFDQKA